MVVKMAGLGRSFTGVAAYCPHGHVVVNRVDPESGKAAGSSRSKLRLPQWADGYEQGQILCSRRVTSNAKRREGNRV